MDINPEYYANIRRNSVRENALCKHLRSLSEEERLKFVMRLIELNPNVGLPIAKRVLRSPASAKEVFELGIHLADASTMKYWLQACVPKLGLKKIISILRDHLETDLDAVDYALYWIPYKRHLALAELTSFQELSDLFQILKQRSGEK